MKSLVKVTPQHYALIRSWYQAQGLDAPRTASFSTSMGYIADGRVAGFLHLMNSDIAMIDGIVCKPQSIPSLRHNSLLKLCGFLCDTAVSLGYPRVYILTDDKELALTSQKLGFSELIDHHIMLLDETP